MGHVAWEGLYFFYIVQHRAVLLICPLILQTAQMLTTTGQKAISLPVPETKTIKTLLCMTRKVSFDSISSSAI